MFDRRKIIFDASDPIDKLLAEDHTDRFCDITAVLNIVPCKTKIEGDGPRPGADDPEIGNQPIDRVHHQMDDFIPFLNPLFDQNICKSVHPFIKLFPCDLASFIFAGYSFNQGHIVRIQPRISG